MIGSKRADKWNRQVMIEKDLPEFGKAYSRTIKKALIAFFLNLVVGMLLVKFTQSDAAIIIFVLISFGIVVSVFSLSAYRLKTFRCPRCKSRTNLYNSEAHASWVAECSDCGIRWKLNLSIAETSL